MSESPEARLHALAEQWRREARGRAGANFRADLIADVYRCCANELEAVLVRSVEAPKDEKMHEEEVGARTRTGNPSDSLTASIDEAQVQLLAWAVVNCHTLARRALARSTSAYDREKWEHVLRICEKAGARSQGVLRASVPTEITDGAVGEAPSLPVPQDEKEHDDHTRVDSDKQV